MDRAIEGIFMKILKLFLGAVLGFFLLVICLRGCIYEMGNTSGRNIVLKRVISPNGNYVLTVYKHLTDLQVVEGKTFFYLNRKMKMFNFQGSIF